MASLDEIRSELPIGDIAARLGVDEATARKAVDDALPALLAGMGANATDPAGAASLERAVKSHDPSLVEGGVNLADVDEEDGRKIVKNVFGDNTDQVVTALDKKEGGARRPHRQAPADPRADRARVPREAVHEEAGGLGARGGVVGRRHRRRARRPPRRRVGRLGRSGGGGGGLGDVLGGLLGGGGSGGSGGGWATCSAASSGAASADRPATMTARRMPRPRAAASVAVIRPGHRPRPPHRLSGCQ